MLKLTAFSAWLPGLARDAGRRAERTRAAHPLLAYAGIVAGEALARLDSGSDGLDAAQIEERLTRYGANVVAGEKRRSHAAELLRRLSNPLNVLLIVLAVVSWFGDDKIGAVIMFAMVAIAVILSWVQESRSDRAAEALRRMVSNTATVRRRDEHGAARIEVSIESLVPGDLVQLSAGDMVPADLRLIAAKDLFINQSALTGESLPVEKFAAIDVEANTPLEARNLCFMGSNVISGSALGVVAATGGGTYFGALAGALSGERAPTSFDLGVRRFALLMLRFIAVMVPLVFLLNGFLKGEWLDAFMFAVAVAVGLTPEMLPMIVSVNLAKGAMAMAKKQVIVKRLPAIQNFGAIDVLCTDKTGTLTQDRVILERHVGVDGVEDEEVLRLAWLNSHYQTGLKNLLDVAVLDALPAATATQLKADYRVVDEVPFDFARRRMSVVVRAPDGAHVLISKGAVAETLAICSEIARGAAVETLTPETLEAARSLARELNADGFRVIAVATRRASAANRAWSVADEAGMTLVGFMAFLDPPKDDAREAIAALRAHGVDVKILTGDNDIVTRHVCRQVGIDHEHVLLGPEIDALGDEELRAAARTTPVFARLNPQQKVRVIEALKRDGRAVGFLGDGINDGPALRAADVGISVDTAVDIAKESADIILLEKSLAVLEEGVLEGRKVFGNILKYIRMTASSNFGNVFSVVGASVLLPFLPMQPVQILVNNLLYDLSQAPVATDEVDAEFLARPRPWDMAAIARFVLCVGPLSSIFDYATFALMWFVFKAAAQPALFQTGWFVESLLSQTLVVHVIRTNRIPFLQSRASTPLILTTILICVIGAALPYSPLAALFGFVPLPHAYWLFLPPILLAYLSLTQAAKGWLVRRFGLT
ncbi:MAG: magnesium-translocating P-type ATPase [Dokdonella sp.]|nr:magnesium-translocating P-type ATPase [Dokdonella sp.]